jgi:hypothetical protein
MKIARLPIPLLPTNVPADLGPLTRTPMSESMTLLTAATSLTLEVSQCR